MANSAETRCEGYSHKLEGPEAREYLRTRGESESLRKGSTWDHIKERIRMNAEEVHQPVDPFDLSYELDHGKWIDSIPHLLGACQISNAFKINAMLFEDYQGTLMGSDRQIVSNIHVEKIDWHRPSGREFIFEVRWMFLAKKENEGLENTYRWIPAVKEFSEKPDDVREMVQHINWLNGFAIREAEENQLEFPF